MDRTFQPIDIETTQPLDMMIHQILNQALVAIDAKAGSVMLVAEKQRILQIKARLGPPRPGRLGERVLSVDSDSIAGWVVRNRQSYLKLAAADVSDCPRLFTLAEIPSRFRWRPASLAWCSTRETSSGCSTSLTS